MRVLLVDDSGPFRDLLAKVADAAGPEVVSATDSGRDSRVVPQRSVTPERLREELGIGATSR